MKVRIRYARVKESGIVTARCGGRKAAVYVMNCMYGTKRSAVSKHRQG